MGDPAAPAEHVAPGAVLRSLLEGEAVIDFWRGEGMPSVGDRLSLRPGGDAALKPAYRLLSAPGIGGIGGSAEVRATERVHLDDQATGALASKTPLDLGPLAGTEVVVLALRVWRDGQPALSDEAFEAKVSGAWQWGHGA
ncbi:MAG: hypothetical protein ACRDY7_01665 [Acidimicrobiia bacterium]